jgi:xanthine/CO dehydrogenase XdhC/CoxF family maturation factor
MSSLELRTMTDLVPDTAAFLDDPLAIAARWREAGEAVALATVTETWGSSPRPPGSRMAISASGRIAGSVSGGCVENAVVEAALETLADRQPRLLSYGVSDSDAWSVGLACGGTLRVFVEPILSRADPGA